MTTPSRLTAGLATVTQGQPLGFYPLPEPFNTAGTQNMGVATYANDFLATWSLGDFTVTGTSSTFLLGTGLGGVAVLLPGGTTTASSIYKTTANNQFVAGQKLWFTTRVAVSSVTAPTAYFGLQYGSAVTDGIWFSMAAGGVLSLVSTVGSTATTLAANLGTMVSGTMLDLGLYYDGLDLQVFVGDALVFRVTAPTIGASGTVLTNKLITPVVQITPTILQTVTCDYVFAAEEVVR